MGVIISSAVIPGALTLLWNRQSKLAVCLSPPLGFFCSITAWLVTAKVQLGTINVETTGSNIPMLVGNVVALLSPVLFVPILSFVKPDKILYDFASMKEIKAVDDGPKNIATITSEEMERELILLKRNSNFARITAVTLFVCLIILWPWPMYGTSYVFSEHFFTGWVILGIVWMFISFCIVGIYPVVEGRKSIASVCKKIYDDLTKKGHEDTDDTDSHPTNDTKMNIKASTIDEK